MEEDEVLNWLERDSHVRLTTLGEPFNLGIQVREGDKLIGFTSLSLREPDYRQAGIHICLNRNWHRKGLGLETVQAVLGFCFADLKLHRVTAACDSRNKAGCKLFAKAGMRPEGEFVKDRLSHDEWINTVWYAMLDEEYGQPKPAGP
jgi:RimJ/RimL family protein N-acetyltransferase